MENTSFTERSGKFLKKSIVELGFAKRAPRGTDLTIVSHGRCAMISLQVAETLERDHDLSVEVIDLRPFVL